jgi:hypothetical protein
VIRGKLEAGRCELPAGEDVWCEKVTARGVDFSGQRFGDTRSRESPPGDGRDDWSSVFMHGCVFEDCDFSGALFDYCELGWGTQTIFRRCAFDGAKMHEVSTRSSLRFGNSRFEECTFLDARLRGWFTDEAEFVGCRFRGPVDRCNFFGRPVNPVTPPRRENEFVANDFRQAELIWCSFRGIRVGEQLWPESREYVLLDRVAARAQRARSEVATWPADDRLHAEVRLDIVVDHAAGTDDWFGRRSEPDDKDFPSELSDRLWGLLEQPL